MRASARDSSDGAAGHDVTHKSARSIRPTSAYFPTAAQKRPFKNCRYGPILLKNSGGGSQWIDRLMGRDE